MCNIASAIGTATTVAAGGAVTDNIAYGEEQLVGVECNEPNGCALETDGDVVTQTEAVNNGNNGKNGGGKNKRRLLATTGVVPQGQHIVVVSVDKTKPYSSSTQYSLKLEGQTEAAPLVVAPAETAGVMGMSTVGFVIFVVALAAVAGGSVMLALRMRKKTAESAQAKEVYDVEDPTPAAPKETTPRKPSLLEKKLAAFGPSKVAVNFATEDDRQDVERSRSSRGPSKKLTSSFSNNSLNKDKARIHVVEFPGFNRPVGNATAFAMTSPDAATNSRSL